MACVAEVGVRHTPVKVQLAEYVPPKKVWEYESRLPYDRLAPSKCVLRLASAAERLGWHLATLAPSRH